MSAFTWTVLGLFVALCLWGAAATAAAGEYGAAALALGIAAFFVVVAMMARFEARHPRPMGSGHSAGRLHVAKELRRYWNVPGWQGKFIVVFLLAVFALGIGLKLAAFVRWMVGS
ncbi:hypothetical protein [uncultured Xylophilus sp.]|uniref:hypothetical protein n=1 Tax=uncultured Xylophilus sp. TaxID=296832 RepID=UPI0025D75A44|nr:hypothetical protein [uncultured Xylophilus sp.]